MPTIGQTINKVFKEAFDEVHIDLLWLAETYDTINVHCGDEHGLNPRNDSYTVVSDDWVSPFAGKNLQDTVEFVRSAPKPPKALNKVYFVVLDKQQYDAQEWLTVYKIVDGNSEVQSLPCTAPCVSDFLFGHDRDTWQDSVEYWQNHEVPVMY